jgi:hypothetical protein
VVKKADVPDKEDVDALLEEVGVGILRQTVPASHASFDCRS